VGALLQSLSGGVGVSLGTEGERGWSCFEKMSWGRDVPERKRGGCTLKRREEVPRNRVSPPGLCLSGWGVVLRSDPGAGGVLPGGFRGVGLYVGGNDFISLVGKWGEKAHFGRGGNTLTFSHSEPKAFLLKCLLGVLWKS